MKVKGKREILLVQIGLGTLVRIQDSRIHSRHGNSLSIEN